MFKALNLRTQSGKLKDANTKRSQKFAKFALHTKYILFHQSHDQLAKPTNVRA